MGLHRARPGVPGFWLLSPLREQQRFLCLRQQTVPGNVVNCSRCCSAPLQSWMRFSEVFTKGVFRPLKTRRILTLTLENLGTMIIKDVCLLISHHN